MGERVMNCRRLLQLGLSAAGLGLMSRSGVASAWQGSGSRVPRVGFVKQPPILDYMDAFHEGMREHGWEDGENYILDYRYVEQQSQLPEVVDELLAIPVDLFVCPNSSAVDAVMRTSSTVPIVFATFSNPLLNG